MVNYKFNSTLLLHFMKLRMNKGSKGLRHNIIAVMCLPVPLCIYGKIVF